MLGATRHCSMRRQHHVPPHLLHQHQQQTSHGKIAQARQPSQFLCSELLAKAKPHTVAIVFHQWRDVTTIHTSGKLKNDMIQEVNATSKLNCLGKVLSIHLLLSVSIQPPSVHLSVRLLWVSKVRWQSSVLLRLFLDGHDRLLEILLLVHVLAPERALKFTYRHHPNRHSHISTAALHTHLSHAYTQMQHIKRTHLHSSSC